MPIYLIARITIKDRQGYGRYEAGFAAVFSQFAGKMLAVDEQPEVLEGEWPCTRTVLIQFPSREEALAWYRSEAYQKLAQHRFDASEGDVVLIDGLPGTEGVNQ